MSDLTAANCSCTDTLGCSTCKSGCGNNMIWVILLLLLASNNGCNSGCGNNGIGLLNNSKSSCNLLIWVLLISCFCGKGIGCGCN